MLGNTLKEARESRDLPLREIEWATKIKASYLEALEAEDFDSLPAPVYARGFLRTYALYLDLAPEPMIAEYNQRHAAATEIVSTRPAVRPEPRPFAITPGMIVAGVMVVLAAIFLLYVKGQFDRYQATRAAATQSSPNVHITPAPSASATPSPQPSPSPSPIRGIQLTIHVDARTWLEVLVDSKPSDQTTSNGTVFPDNTTLSFQGDKTVRVITGRAGHTFINVNGHDLGPLAAGDVGVGDHTYTPASANAAPGAAQP
jgi:cytoskeletal protein RodZ